MKKMMMNDYLNEEITDQNSRTIKLEDAISKPDLSIIESKDPSLSDGFKIIYNKEVPLYLKHQTNEGLEDFASSELINFKILSDATSEEAPPSRVKIELTWEKDLLFHYSNIIDEQKYLDIKKKQRFLIDFPEYCNTIQKICEYCITNPDIYIGEFTIEKNMIPELRFMKSSPFKYLDLLVLEFKNSPNEIIRKQLLYKFSYIKSKIEYNKKAIKAAGDVILDLNPDIMNPILDKKNNYILDINKFFCNKFEEN